MPEWLGEALAMVKPYWSAVALLLVFWYLTNVGKKQFWTREAAANGGVMKFMRKTMSLHPLVGGVAWGSLYPFMPAVEFVTTKGGAITQGLLMGVASMLIFKVLKSEAKKRGWTSILRVLSTVGDRTTTVPPDKS